MRRVGVAGEHRAEAGVEVDVLVAVDVPDPRARAALDEHRARRGVLPRRGDAAGEVGRCATWSSCERRVRASSAASCSAIRRVEGVEVPVGRADQSHGRSLLTDASVSKD